MFHLKKIDFLWNCFVCNDIFRYEIGPNRFSEGGFGGGGSGYLSAFGGGGGYSGGGGGPTGGYSGGGGSFVKITGGKEQAEVTNTMPGFVRISVIGEFMILMKTLYKRHRLSISNIVSPTSTRTTYMT